MTKPKPPSLIKPSTVSSPNRDFPWYFSGTGEEVHAPHFETAFPDFKYIKDANWYYLSGVYNNKHVSWLPARKCWVYKNNHNIKFATDSSEGSQEEDTKAKTLEEPSSPASKAPSKASDQAEVSQLLDSATSTVTALITQVS